MEKKLKISKDFIFNFENNIGIDSSRIVLKKYHDNFQKASNLDGEYPIFLDTNILLNYYGMSQENKKKLKTFFEDKVKEIHLTQQIEKEFQRNRESAISDYFQTLHEIKSNYENDLQKGVKNKFQNILQSKIVEQDFPEIMEAIEKIYNELDVKLFSNDSLLDKVSENVKNSINESENLLFVDPILDVYSKFQRIPDLSGDELDTLSRKYQEYLPIFKEAKESVKNRFTFPGCGESKSNDKEGDFIIFHEILKFMKENDSDAILLTRDVTKSDWLKKNREPFIHYILKAYQLTGHTLYIFDATDLLRIISFDNIYKTDTSIISEDDLENNQIENYYRNRFSNIVKTVQGYFEGTSDEFKNFAQLDRRLFDIDLDLICQRKSGNKVGFLVYQCGSTKKGFQKNVQKRINTCNRFLSNNLTDEAILCIVLTKKSYLTRLDIDYLETKHNIRLVIFLSKNLDEAELELLKDFQLFKLN